MTAVDSSTVRYKFYTILHWVRSPDNTITWVYRSLLCTDANSRVRVACSCRDSFARRRFLNATLRIHTVSMLAHFTSIRPTESGNAIASVRPSMCPSVCIFSIFWTDRPLTLIFCMWVGHDHGSREIEGKGNRSCVGLMRSVYVNNVSQVGNVNSLLC